MFEIRACDIPGCFQVLFKKHSDKRGDFIKTYHKEMFDELNIRLDLREEYFTVSHRNVFRGLHFQEPPKALDKLVYCISGQVTDYLVDIRKGSPAFGKWVSFELDGDKPSAIYAPVGIAHGFYARSASAVLQYKVSETYDASTDTGILYKTFSFAKEFPDAIVSDRDLGFKPITEYQTPFIYQP